MNQHINIGSLLAEPLDTLLADIAIRVQLSETNYRKAVERYRAVHEHIERESSPLHDRVVLFHPQGSMAIGATISSKLENDEFDIDLIAILDLPADTPPHSMLDILEEAIRGEPESRYYDKTNRCTRCIQILYADGMHLDVTPMVRIHALPEKCGYIYHAPERYATQEDKKAVANPWGFAKHFLERTPVDELFEAAFLERARAYEASLPFAEAVVEPVPEQEPIHAKSAAVVSLQLMKRFRNVRYDQREERWPPSVMMAKVVADNAARTSTLSDELIFQASQLRDLLEAAQRDGRLLEVRNPKCDPDLFTDRWPGHLPAQRVFLDDMNVFVEKLESLRGECDLPKMQATLAELFGEKPTVEAVKQLNQRMGRQIIDGRSQHVPGTGRIVLPPAASATLLGVASSSFAGVRATPKHTHFGSPPRR